jgi:hypothetical protein
VKVYVAVVWMMVKSSRMKTSSRLYQPKHQLKDRRSMRIRECILMADARGGAPLPVQRGTKSLATLARWTGPEIHEGVLADELVGIVRFSPITAGVALSSYFMSCPDII